MNTTTPPLWTDLQCPQHKDKGTVSCWVLLCQTYHIILSFQGTLEWIYKLSDTEEEEIWKLRIFNLLHIVMLNVPVEDSFAEETKILLIFKSCGALALITGHWHPSLVAQFAADMEWHLPGLSLAIQQLLGHRGTFVCVLCHQPEVSQQVIVWELFHFWFFYQSLETDETCWERQ